jgi:hypothetical protein
MADSSKNGNEGMGSLKGGQFLELSDSRLLKNDSAPWSYLVNTEILEVQQYDQVSFTHGAASSTTQCLDVMRSLDR